MARAHLYQPIFKTPGGLASYVAVTFLDSATGLPTAVPLYASPTSGSPIDNPAQFSPGVVEVWTDVPTRLDLRLTIDGTLAQTIYGIDVNPAAAEILTFPGGLEVDGTSKVTQILAKATGPTAGWADYKNVPAHQHIGVSAHSVIVGDAQDTANPFPFVIAGSSGGTLVQPISASVSGGTAGASMAFMVTDDVDFRSIRLYCARTPTGTGGARIGIASAIGANPGAVTWIQSVTGRSLVAGQNIITLPAAVRLTAGTVYYIVLVSSGQDVWAVNTTGGVLAGAVALTQPAVGGGSSSTTITYGLGSTATDRFTEGFNYTAASANWVNAGYYHLAGRIAQGLRAGQYYVFNGSSLLATTSPSSVNLSLFRPPYLGLGGHVEAFSYYSILFRGNSIAWTVPGFQDTTFLAPGDEVARIKVALGSMLTGVVTFPTGSAQLEPTLQFAATSATAWSTVGGTGGAFDIGDVIGVQDTGPDSTWVGIDTGAEGAEVDHTTAFGNRVRPVGDKSTFMGSNTTGQIDSGGVLPSQSTVVGVASAGYFNSVIIDSEFIPSGASPVLWIGSNQIQITPSYFQIGVYNDAAGVVFLGNLTSGATPADIGGFTSFHLQNDTTMVPGTFSNLLDARIGGASQTIGFFGSAGAVKPATFSHSSTVALQNLLVALQALGLVVSS